MESLLSLAADPGVEQIIRILDGLRGALVAALTTLALVALTYAGVRYVISVGDPAGIERAKSAVKAAVIGLALALLAPVLIAVVKQIVGG